MRRALLTLAFVSIAVPSAAAPPPLAERDVAGLRRAILPVEGEDAFASIPWETNLWEARKKAAAQGKPLLLWEMDGNPLGCG